MRIIDSQPEKPAEAPPAGSKPRGAGHPDACVLCSGRGWSVESKLRFFGPDIQQKVICPDCGGFGVKRENLWDLLDTLVKLIQPKPEDVFEDLEDWAARNGWLHPERNDFEDEIRKLGWIRRENRR